MRQIQKLLTLAICSALINTASALEHPISEDTAVIEPAQVVEDPVPNNAAQTQRTENLALAVQQNLVGATEQAEQTIEISQFLVEDAQQTLASAQAKFDAVSSDSDNAEELASANNNLEQARQALSVALNGLETANQQLASISAVSAEDISEMRESGMG